MKPTEFLRAVVLSLPNTEPFNTVPNVATPNHIIISLLLNNCYFATVMNHNLIYRFLTYRLRPWSPSFRIKIERAEGTAPWWSPCVAHSRPGISP